MGGVNIAKVLIIAMVASAVAAGAAMYYLQVYAFYEEYDAGEVVLTTLDGVAETVVTENFRAIDSDSSPIRYRACFDMQMSVAALTETYEVYEGAEPLVAPGWFDCFDAQAIGVALEDGSAFAFMGQENVTYGVDRVVAVFPDGRAVSWHQINACGERVFDGEAAPEGCPPAPERLQ